ncbi:MAG: ubiquinone biosynthesis protein UbiB, partial [Pseudomonadota bacterium]
KLVAQNIRHVADRLKRLPEVMDQFEAKLAAPEIAPPPRERFAPWWGWFGFMLALVGLFAAIVIAD